MSSSTGVRLLAWLLAAMAFALANLLLLTNPGYFSHDELQWGARAAVARFNALPFVGWTEFSAFQYRPLTFNLWLVLSWLAFDAAWAMHALWLAFGFGVCALLHLTLRRLRASPWLAFAGAAAFATSPFASFTHGWVATLGDLLWVAAALGIAFGVLGRGREDSRAPFAIAVVGTTIALLAKEGALAITPLLALAWLLSNRERRWCAALLGSALPTAAYLALRLSLLMFAPRPQGAYSWALDAIPMRWEEMQLWPFLVVTFELTGVAHASTARTIVAVVIAASLALCTWRAGGRLLLAYLVGGVLALGPALVLHVGYPHYGYGYSVLACVCFTLAWPRLPRSWRIVLILALLLSVWHGANVQRELRRVGELEARFTPGLRSALKEHPGTLSLFLRRPEDSAPYRRLIVAQANPYEGQPQREIALVQELEGASHEVAIDGRVRARSRDR